MQMLRFRLRTLLIFVVAASCALGLFYWHFRVARQQQETVATLERMQGVVIFYDYQLDENDEFIEAAQPPAPKWLCKLLGRDFFADVAWVGLLNTRAGDDDLGNMTPLLQSLPDLEGVSIYDPKITLESASRLQGVLPGRDVNKHDLPES